MGICCSASAAVDSCRLIESWCTRLTAVTSPTACQGLLAGGERASRWELSRPARQTARMPCYRMVRDGQSGGYWRQYPAASMAANSKRCFSRRLSSGFPRPETQKQSEQGDEWMVIAMDGCQLQVQLVQLVQHRAQPHTQRPVTANGLGLLSQHHLHRLHPILRRLAQPLTAAAGWPQLRPPSSVVRFDGMGESRFVLFLPPPLVALPDCNCGGLRLLRPRRKRIPGATRPRGERAIMTCGPFQRPQRGILAPSFEAAGQTLVGHHGHVHLVLWYSRRHDTGGTWVAR